MAVLAPSSRSSAPRWLIRHATAAGDDSSSRWRILGLFNERFLTIDNLLNSWLA